MAIDKMLRIAGRATDGTAKAIKTDIDGNIGVQITGSIIKLLEWTLPTPLLSTQKWFNSSNVDISTINATTIKVIASSPNPILLRLEWANGIKSDVYVGYSQSVVFERSGEIFTVGIMELNTYNIGVRVNIKVWGEA